MKNGFSLESIKEVKYQLNRFETAGFEIKQERTGGGKGVLLQFFLISLKGTQIHSKAVGKYDNSSN